jgi:hypothetical protein
MLDFERVEQGFIIVPVFTWQDERPGVESVFQAIPTDDSASFGGLGAGAFLCVLPVGLYLSFGCHSSNSLSNPRVAGGS